MYTYMCVCIYLSLSLYIYLWLLAACSGWAALAAAAPCTALSLGYTLTLYYITLYYNIVCYVILYLYCVVSLRSGHANLLCLVPILTDDPRRQSIILCVSLWGGSARAGDHPGSARPLCPRSFSIDDLPTRDGVARFRKCSLPLPLSLSLSLFLFLMFSLSLSLSLFFL